MLEWYDIAIAVAAPLLCVTFGLGFVGFVMFQDAPANTAHERRMFWLFVGAAIIATASTSVLIAAARAIPDEPTQQCRVEEQP